MRAPIARFIRVTMVGLAGSLTAALGAGLAMPTQAAGASGTPQVATARAVTNLFDGTRVFEAPQVAADPKDPGTLVLVAGNYHYPGGCYLYVSRDYGASWSLASGSLLPPGYQFCVDRPISGRYARPVFASNGTLYIGFGAAGGAGFPNNPSSALMAVTSDLGATHHTYVVDASHQVTGTNPTTKQPATAMTQVHTMDVAVDPTDPNRVYMSWLLTTTPPAGYHGFVQGTFSVVKPQETLISVSDNGGRTWSAPFNLTATAHPALPKGSGTGAPSLVVGTDGTVYAFAAESQQKGSKGLNHLVMFKSANHGRGWSATVVDFSVPSAYQSLSLPQVAVDPTTGELFLADQVALGSPSGMGSDNSIYVARSTDGGQSWTTPVDVVDTAASAAYDQYHPGISVAPNGRVDVAWQDFRSDPFYKLGANGLPVAGSAKSEDYYDIYASYSTDHGVSWAPNIRVSSQTIDSTLGVEFPNAADGPVGIASTNDEMYVAWGSPAAGAAAASPEDSYVNVVRFASPVAAAPSNQHSALWGIIGGGSALLLAGLVLLVAASLGRRRTRNVVPGPAPQAT